ncbi:integrin-like repeat-containing protein [Candidatus Magnetomorum sp. HK-1]|nr:integrin-like repeat-containing protein [Candidatus Magnetomorum sp. HK-1]
MKKLIFYCISIIIFCNSNIQAKTDGVLIIPFVINDTHNQPILKKMISDMLFSRLNLSQCMPVIDYRKLNMVKNSNIDDIKAREIAKQQKLSHVIIGSVSIFGGQYSIDTQLYRINENKPFYTNASLAASEKEVLPKIHEMSLEIKNVLCGNEFDPHVSNSTSKLGKFTIKAFPHLDMKSRAITIADINQDRHPELFVADKHNVYLFDISTNNLNLLGQYNVHHVYKIIRMDAADLDNDQQPEIFVTSINKLSGQVASFVLIWKLNELKVILQDEPFYFRCFQRFDKSIKLIGQKQSMNDFFSKKVFLLKYHQKKLFIEKTQAIPPNSNFASFHQGQFTGSKKDFVIVRSDNKIELLDASLRRKWLSETHYAESQNILTLPQKVQHQNEKYIYLNQRLQVCDVDQDNIDELIVSEHHASSGGRLFQRYRQYHSGVITCLKWNGLGMIPLWKTPQVSGYISDYMWFDITGTGKMCIAVAAVTKQSMFKNCQTQILLFYDR